MKNVLLILLLIGAVSCVKKVEIEIPYTPRIPLEIDELDLDELPEDSGDTGYLDD